MLIQNRRRGRRRLFLIKRVGRSCPLILCVLAINTSLDCSSLSEEHTDRQRDGERDRGFSSICLCSHSILGTHSKTQTHRLTNVNTHNCEYTHRRLAFFKNVVTALVCIMSAHCIQIRSGNTHMPENRC